MKPEPHSSSVTPATTLLISNISPRTTDLPSAPWDTNQSSIPVNVLSSTALLGWKGLSLALANPGCMLLKPNVTVGVLSHVHYVFQWLIIEKQIFSEVWYLISRDLYIWQKPANICNSIKPQIPILQCMHANNSAEGTFSCPSRPAHDKLEK